MNEIIEASRSILASKPRFQASVDLCHGVILLGTLMSIKPENVLEIGIGPGFCSDMIIEALGYNNKGQLTCVDNMHDLGGNLPHDVLARLQQKATVIKSSERDFVYSSPDNTYDFLVSDGDHQHAGEWTEEIFRIIRPNSFMFFHDVNPREYPNLMNYKTEADRLGKPNYLFNASSRGDEQCGRGWLMIINKK